MENLSGPTQTLPDELFIIDSPSLMNDLQILAHPGMIQPFVPRIIREEDGHKVFSYGLGSYGYDIRLSPNEFYTFRHKPGSVVDPKNFDRSHLELADLHHSEEGDYFIIPGNSYGLGVALERLTMPKDVTAMAMGKSSYARVGIIANITPVEAGWVGHLTLEFSNSSKADCRIYANEGVIQLMFFKGFPCQTSYADRSDPKYQYQPCQVMTSKV